MNANLLKRSEIDRAYIWSVEDLYQSDALFDRECADVVRALEEEMEFITCVAQGNVCTCPTKNVWKKLYDGINSVLDSITLQNMIDDYRHVGQSDLCNAQEKD